MKKLTAIILCIALVISISACTKKTTSGEVPTISPEAAALLPTDGWVDLPDSTSTNRTSTPIITAEITSPIVNTTATAKPAVTATKNTIKPTASANITAAPTPVSGTLQLYYTPKYAKGFHPAS